MQSETKTADDVGLHCLMKVAFVIVGIVCIVGCCRFNFYSGLTNRKANQQKRKHKLVLYAGHTIGRANRCKNQMTIVCCRVFHNKQCFVSTAATYKSDEKRCCAKVWSDLLSINIIPILMSNIKQSSPKPTSPSSFSLCSTQLGQQHSLHQAPRSWKTN